ncbi:MAG: leucine-rich repeat domain-containing protein [Candidatus Helarchaeota archaeon]
MKKNKIFKVLESIKLKKEEISVIKDIIQNFDEYLQLIEKTKDISYYSGSGFVVQDESVVTLVLSGSFDTRNVPSSISELKYLKKLKLNNIQNIPASIKTLHYLEELFVVGLENQSSLDSIGYLKNLKILSLEGNMITDLPSSIGNLTKLEKLILNNNQLSIRSFPKSFASLSNLKELYLSEQDKRFKMLGVSKTFHEIPKEIFQLFNLIHLDLSDNGIYVIPEQIGQLKNLIELNLSKNNIKYLPSSLGNLRALERLNLYRNNIGRIPITLGNLRNLKILDLRNNSLLELPEGLYFENLEELRLSNNHIRTVPDTIWGLINLKWMDLRHNEVKYLPKSFKKMVALEHLDLYDNPDLKITKSIAELFEKKISISLSETASKIAPELLYSKKLSLQQTILEIFEKSVKKLENIEDFILFYLNINTQIKKYLLKFGTRLIASINALLVKENNQEKKQKLSELLEDIENRTRKSNIRVQFINLMDMEGSKSYPMGILYISAWLKDHGYFNLKYIDYFCFLRSFASSKNEIFLRRWTDEYGKKKVEELKTKFIDELISFCPHVVLIGPITTPNLVELVELIPKVRKILPHSILMAGGPHFGKDKLMDLELLTKYCPDLDGIIIGEAEESVVELIDLYYKYSVESSFQSIKSAFLKELELIKGVMTRTNNYQAREKPNLITFPFPDLDLLEDYSKSKLYHLEYSLCERRDPFIGFYERVVTMYDGHGDAYYSEDRFFFDDLTKNSREIPFAIISGSRDCPYSCDFCCSQGKRRVHSAKYIFDLMMEFYTRFETTLFVFFDPLFTSTAPQEIRRIEKLCDLILKSKKDFKFLVELRADVILQLPNELLIKLIKSGCTQFNLGLEKGYDEGLKLMMKNIFIQDHRDAIKKLREMSLEAGKKILINGTFILGGPEEDKNGVLKTILHLFTLGLDGNAIFTLEIHPGTQLYERAIKEEKISSGLSPYLNPKFYPKYGSNGLTPRELEIIEKRTRDYLLRHVRDFQNKILRFEENFSDNKPRLDFYFLENYKPGSLNYELNDFIYKIFKFLPFQGFRAKFIHFIMIFIKSFKFFILFQKLEETIKKKYPKYEGLAGEYRFGSLESSFKSLIKQTFSFIKFLRMTFKE